MLNSDGETVPSPATEVPSRQGTGPAPVDPINLRPRRSKPVSFGNDAEWTAYSNSTGGGSPYALPPSAPDRRGGVPASHVPLRRVGSAPHLHYWNGAEGTDGPLGGTSAEGDYGQSSVRRESDIGAVGSMMDADALASRGSVVRVKLRRTTGGKGEEGGLHSVPSMTDLNVSGGAASRTVRERCVIGRCGRYSRCLTLLSVCIMYIISPAAPPRSPPLTPLSIYHPLPLTSALQLYYASGNGTDGGGQQHGGGGVACVPGSGSSTPMLQLDVGRLSLLSAPVTPHVGMMDQGFPGGGGPNIAGGIPNGGGMGTHVSFRARQQPPPPPPPPQLTFQQQLMMHPQFGDGVVGGSPDYRYPGGTRPHVHTPTHQQQQQQFSRANSACSTPPPESPSGGSAAGASRKRPLMVAGAAAGAAAAGGAAPPSSSSSTSAQGSPPKSTSGGPGSSGSANGYGPANVGSGAPGGRGTPRTASSLSRVASAVGLQHLAVSGGVAAGSLSSGSSAGYGQLSRGLQQHPTLGPGPFRRANSNFYTTTTHESEAAGASGGAEFGPSSAYASSTMGVEYGPASAYGPAAAALGDAGADGQYYAQYTQQPREFATGPPMYRWNSGGGSSHCSSSSAVGGVMPLIIPGLLDLEREREAEMVGASGDNAYFHSSAAASAAAAVHAYPQQQQQLPVVFSAQQPAGGVYSSFEFVAPRGSRNLVTGHSVSPVSGPPLQQQQHSSVAAPAASSLHGHHTLSGASLHAHHGLSSGNVASGHSSQNDLSAVLQGDHVWPHGGGGSDDAIISRPTPRAAAASISPSHSYVPSPQPHAGGGSRSSGNHLPGMSPGSVIYDMHHNAAATATTAGASGTSMFVGVHDTKAVNSNRTAVVSSSVFGFYDVVAAGSGSRAAAAAAAPSSGPIMMTFGSGMMMGMPSSFMPADRSDASPHPQNNGDDMHHHHRHSTHGRFEDEEQAHSAVMGFLSSSTASTSAAPPSVLPSSSEVHAGATATSSGGVFEDAHAHGLLFSTATTAAAPAAVAVSMPSGVIPVSGNSSIAAAAAAAAPTTAVVGESASTRSSTTLSAASSSSGTCASSYEALSTELSGKEGIVPSFSNSSSNSSSSSSSSSLWKKGAAASLVSAPASPPSAGDSYTPHVGAHASQPLPAPSSITAASASSAALQRSPLSFEPMGSAAEFAAKYLIPTLTCTTADGSDSLGGSGGCFSGGSSSPVNAGSRSGKSGGGGGHGPNNFRRPSLGRVSSSGVGAYEIIGSPVLAALRMGVAGPSLEGRNVHRSVSMGNFSAHAGDER